MSILDRKTDGVADHCEYSECGKPAAGELRGHNLVRRSGIPWALCDEHLKPGHHPVDLRKKLVKWRTLGRAA